MPKMALRYAAEAVRRGGRRRRLRRLVAALSLASAPLSSPLRSPEIPPPGDTSRPAPYPMANTDSRLVRELLSRQPVVVRHLELTRSFGRRIRATRDVADEPVVVTAADADETGTSTARRLVPIWLYDAGLAIVALTIWGDVLYSTASEPLFHTPVPWWAFALVFYLAEAHVVHLQFRHETHTTSLSEAGLVLGLYVLSPEGLLVATLAGAAAALVLARRQRGAKLVFNLARLAITTAVALVVFRAVAATGDPFGPAGWAGVTLGAVAASLAGSVLVIVAMAKRSPDGRRIPVPVATPLLSAVAISNTVLIAITLARAERASIVLLVLPAAIAVMAFRAHVAQRAGSCTSSSSTNR